MLTKLGPAALLLFTSSILAAIPQTTNYFGTINGDIPIAMALDTGSFEKITSSYLYTQHGKILYLSGTYER
jgi:hypothetical protein